MNESEIDNPTETAPLKRKEGIFDEGFLIVITGLGNVFNFYFHIYMSRNLAGPEGYSVLASLLSGLVIVAIPIITVQTTITKFVAQFNARGEHGKVRRVLLESLKHISIFAFVLMSLTIIGAPFIAEFFHIQKNTPVIVCGVLIFSTYLMPVFWGILQGREQFGFLGTSYLVGFTTKCVLGILFAIIGWGVGGVLFGIVLSFVLAFAVVISPIREVLAQIADDDHVDMKDLYKFALPTIIALLAMSPYCQLDVMIVRHFYGGSESNLTLAGYYATASIIGKAFYFLPMGIVLALFPKVARKKAMGENPVPVLMRGLGLEIVLSVGGIIGCLVLGRYVALVLGRTDAPELVALIRMFGIAITPVAATMILVNFNLANERYGFIWMLVPLTIFTFLGIWLFHGTLMTVLVIMGTGGLILFFSILGFTILSFKGTTPGSLPEAEV